MLTDLRYALRKLRLSPGFTTVAALTLALGIGANTAIFSVVNAVLLRPLPYPDPDALLLVTQFQHGHRSTVSPPNFHDVRAESRSFSGMAATDDNTYNLTGRGDPERLRGAVVSASFFSVLDVAAAHGRTFAPDEDSPNAPRVTVLSDDLWRRRFGADPAIIGRPIALDGQQYTVIGIAPAGIHYPGHAELWTPLVFQPDDFAENHRGAQYLRVIARLSSGTTLETARAELAAIGRRHAQLHPEHNTDNSYDATPLAEIMVGKIRPKLLVLLGAVGLVLLIACTNVANLLLARAAGRQHEIAIRTALGASRNRLARQMVTESLVLSVLGGALGLILATWMMDLLASLGPRDIPRLDEVRLDATVVLVTLVATVVTGIVFGLLPALGASRPNLDRGLREGGRSVRGGPGTARLRAGLVVCETAFALMLLIGAGLLIRSFERLQRVDPGFQPAHVLTFSIMLPDVKYPNDTARRVAVSSLQQRLQVLPGVESAALVFGSLPLNDFSWNISYDIGGHPPAPPGHEPNAEIRPVTPGYFATLGIPIVQGRGFTDRDRDGAPRAVIVNREFVRRSLPNEDPIGRQVILGWNQNGVNQGGEIVGVIGDVRQFTLDHDPTPEVYLTLDQRPMPGLNVALRTTADPAALTTLARKAVHEVDPDLAIYDTRTMEQVVSESVAQPRFYTMLLTVFAALALTLAAVGLYGVIAYGVSQRVHEIGVRLALGARQADVVRLVVLQGVGLTAAGLGVGLALALALTRLLSGLLYGVTSTDPMTFVAVPLLLAAVATFASWLPARRAARIDPIQALRAE